VLKTRRVPKWIEVPGVKRITRMVPVESTRMVTQYQEETVMVDKVILKCIVEYEYQPRIIKRRVQVPCEKSCSCSSTCNSGCMA